VGNGVQIAPNAIGLIHVDPRETKPQADMVHRQPFGRFLARIMQIGLEELEETLVAGLFAPFDGEAVVEPRLGEGEPAGADDVVDEKDDREFETLRLIGEADIDGRVALDLSKHLAQIGPDPVVIRVRGGAAGSLETAQILKDRFVEFEEFHGAEPTVI
jgi:hypothetical protein